MNQVSKHTKTTSKYEYFEAKKGRTFITPQNKTYVFDFRTEGRKYIIILNYMGYKMQVSESDFNLTNIDDLLNCISKELLTLK